MTNEREQQFIDALHTYEESGDLDTLIGLYAEDGEVDNVNLPQPLKGLDGVRRFWEEYRSLFAEIHSDFSKVIVQGDDAVLEWTGRGKFAASGEAFEYDGVSLLIPRRQDHVPPGYYDSTP
ncbi:MAG: nuclear transport factor 2 family protein [Chloroflexia bacterium]